jgi:hypothetical protein
MISKKVKREAAEIIASLLKQLNAEERRMAVVRMVMDAEGVNCADIARKHHLTRSYIGGCVRGDFPWSPRVVLALEAELRVSMRPLLTEAEAVKMAEHEAGR